MSKLSVDGKGSKLVVSGGTSEGVSQSQLDDIYNKSRQDDAQLKFYTDQELDRLEKKIDAAIAQAGQLFLAYPRTSPLQPVTSACSSTVLVCVKSNRT